MELTPNTEVPQGGVKGGSGKRVKNHNLCLYMKDLWGWTAQSTAGEAAERAELRGTSSTKENGSTPNFKKDRQ